MDYTRVTVHGTTHRGDLVVPDSEPLAALLPRLMELLEENSARTSGMALTTVDGVQLNPDASLSDQGIHNGELLLFVPLDQAPPPPEISDLTQAVASQRSTNSGLWTLNKARWTAMLLEAPLAGFAAIQFSKISLTATVWTIAILTLTAIGLCRRGLKWPTPALLAAAIGASVPLVAAWSMRFDIAHEHSRLVPLSAGFAMLWLIVALGPGLVAQRRSLLSAGLVGVLAWLSIPALLASGLSPAKAGALVSVSSAFLLGLVPGLALSLSGLTGLDDLVLTGTKTETTKARLTVEDTFITLTGLVLALAAPLGVGMHLLGSSLTSNWAWGLLTCLTFIVFARSRFFPFVQQVLALYAVVLATGVSVLADPARSGMQRGVCAAMLATIIIVILLRDPPEHVSARVRTWMNTLETLAIVATIPLTLGYFDVYSDLLKVFQR